MNKVIADNIRWCIEDKTIREVKEFLNTFSEDDVIIFEYNWSDEISINIVRKESPEEEKKRLAKEAEEKKAKALAKKLAQYNKLKEELKDVL